MTAVGRFLPLDIVSRFSLPNDSCGSAATDPYWWEDLSSKSIPETLNARRLQLHLLGQVYLSNDTSTITSYCGDRPMRSRAITDSPWPRDSRSARLTPCSADVVSDMPGSFGLQGCSWFPRVTDPVRTASLARTPTGLPVADAYVPQPTAGLRTSPHWAGVSSLSCSQVNGDPP